MRRNTSLDLFKSPQSRGLLLEGFAGRDFSGRSLRGIDLSGQNCECASFAGADLMEARCIGTSLQYADLRRARCRDAVFRHVCLYGADLRDTCLDGARFEDCDLRYTKFSAGVCIPSSTTRADLPEPRGSKGVRPGASQAGWGDSLVLLAGPGEQRFADELRRYLAPLVRKLRLRLWDTSQLQPGRGCTLQIEAEIRRARVVVPFLSAALLDSELLNPALLFAFAQQSSGQARVIPIRARACLAKEVPCMHDLHMLPSDGGWVAGRRDRGRIWAQIAGCISLLGNRFS